MAITTSVPPARAAVARAGAGRWLGTLGLGGLVAAMAGLGASAASGAGGLVPAARAGLPGWLAGPLRGLGVSADPQALLLMICAAYALVLACAPALSRGVLWSGIGLAHLAALAGPPLFSADVFGYLDFARLGALHGLDPYTHTAAAAVHDAVYPYLGWHDVRSPYGPLFTLLTYGLVPLGVAGGIWALKAIAVAASLATVAVVWRAAGRRGQSRQRAAVLLGLNPVVLVFAVGGAHNDTLLGLLVAAGLVACLEGAGSAAPADRLGPGGGSKPAAAPAERLGPGGGSDPAAAPAERLGPGRGSGAAAGAAVLVAAAGVKVSAGLALPFALLGARGAGRGRPAAAAAAGAAAAVALIAVIGFGPHATAIADTVRGQQQVVATHSLPSEVSRLLGYGRLGGGVRVAFTVLLAVGLAAALAHAWRRPDRWLEAYGWATLAVLASTAWLLPWYGLWALVPAALSGERRLGRATLLLCAYLVATRLSLADPLLGG